MTHFHPSVAVLPHDNNWLQSESGHSPHLLERPVSGGDDETVLAVKQTRIETTVTGDSVADLVRAHDAAVADLSRRIADTIRAL